MVWGSVLGACTLLLLLASASSSLGWSGRCHRLPPCLTRRNLVNRLGRWNVKGINVNTKREEVVDVFREGKFDLLALTKLNENGDVSRCGLNGIITGVQEMERAREGLAILLNDLWHSAVIDFDVLALETSGLNSNFQVLKFVWWWGMAPMKEIGKKVTDAGMTWTGLWIEKIMGIY